MQFLKRYFLSKYEKDSSFDQKKATFLFYFILAALSMAVIVFISQLVLGMGRLYNAGGAVALIGTVGALFLFRSRHVEYAGHLMAFAILFMVILQNVYYDIYNSDPAMRYRIYLDTASLIGVYFLILSFFRSKAVIYFYGVMFEIILFTHSLVIYFNLKHLPGMTAFVWQHFATVFMAVVAVALISTWLLDYMNTMVQQNHDYAVREKADLEKMVEERTYDLQTSNEKLREFAHIVSHDLKEPLRTISGFVTLINRELHRMGYDEGDIRDYVRHVTRGTRQMEHLISDILTYSKLNIAEKPTEVVDVEQVIRETRSTLAKAIYESEAQIVVEDLEDVTGDKRLLTQLFQNLVSNAIKYRREDVTPVITIGCWYAEGVTCYYVKDNGIGIKEEYYDTIFQAFKRLHSRVEYEGTGIGLAICKKIVDVHRGKIWVESNEGQGTAFYFTLPRAYAEMPAMYPVVHAA